MFRLIEPSSGKFTNHIEGTFSRRTHCGIPNVYKSHDNERHKWLLKYWYLPAIRTLRFLNRTSWYTYVRRTNNTHTFFHQLFNSAILSSTCFELSVPHQEDWYTKLCGILSCIYISSIVTVRMWVYSLSILTKQYSHCQDVGILTSWQWLYCLYRCMIKYHKASCNNLPDDEHLVVRNMSKAI
jgi:hypothetical protein